MDWAGGQMTEGVGGMCWKGLEGSGGPWEEIHIQELRRAVPALGLLEATPAVTWKLAESVGVWGCVGVRLCE